MRRGLQRRGEDAQLASTTLDMFQLLMSRSKVSALKNIAAHAHTRRGAR